MIGSNGRRTDAPRSRDRPRLRHRARGRVDDDDPARGAALSEPLFDRIGPAGLVALRLALAALILWPVVRPRLRGRTREDLAAAVALGAC